MQKPMLKSVFLFVLLPLLPSLLVSSIAVEKSGTVLISFLLAFVQSLFPQKSSLFYLHSREPTLLDAVLGLGLLCVSRTLVMESRHQEKQSKEGRTEVS